MKINNKFAIGCLVQWYEIELIGEYLQSVKNALDRARMRQANRIFDSRGQVLTKKELVNIEAEDILQSTIFD